MPKQGKSRVHVKSNDEALILPNPVVFPDSSVLKDSSAWIAEAPIVPLNNGSSMRARSNAGRHSQCRRRG